MLGTVQAYFLPMKSEVQVTFSQHFDNRKYGTVNNTFQSIFFPDEYSTELALTYFNFRTEM